MRVSDPVVALTHIRIIDGTGAPAQADRTLVVTRGNIAQILPPGTLPPKGATVLDLSGRSVLPGMVGLHNHLFYIARPNMAADRAPEDPLLVPQMSFSAPRLYLAGGVTTMRTTGSVEPYADLNLKREIDAGRLAGPHIDVTGPYLEGPGGHFLQMMVLRDAEDARRTVEFWADRGATSFKAYTDITRDELGAAIQAAHRRGLKITGHLCSVTYTEAISLGIDDLEHGFVVDTDLDPGKTLDSCSKSAGSDTLKALTPESEAGRTLIADLVSHHVAVTSTLPVFEHFHRDDTPASPALLAVLSPQARDARAALLRHIAGLHRPGRETMWRNDLAMEKAFADAGGLLLAGPDPTGAGDVVPGFSDAREVELLTEAGFSPLASIRIATLNGATFLGEAAQIGSVEVGKRADLLVVRGDPSARIEDIENVELVFKDGIGWDSAKLRASVAGRYGLY